VPAAGRHGRIKGEVPMPTVTVVERYRARRRRRARRRHRPRRTIDGYRHHHYEFRTYLEGLG
jgi:hypothetical protein